MTRSAYSLKILQMSFNYIFQLHISDIDQLRIRVSETKNSLADRIGDVEQQLGTEIDKMKITINLLKELKQLNGEESSSFGSHLDQIDEKKARLKYICHYIFIDITTLNFENLLHPTLIQGIVKIIFLKK